MILISKRKQIIVGIDPGDFVITTSDLSEGAALEIAVDQYLKELGAQDPLYRVSLKL